MENSKAEAQAVKNVIDSLETDSQNEGADYRIPSVQHQPLEWPAITDPGTDLNSPKILDERIASPHDRRNADTQIPDSSSASGTQQHWTNIETDQQLVNELAGTLSLADDTPGWQKSAPKRDAQKPVSLFKRLKDIFKL